MILSLRFFESLCDVNDFVVGESYYEMTEGDAPAIYFQLIDSTKDRAVGGFSPPGRRYCPEAGSTLSVVIDHIDDARKLTRPAVQPFPTLDPSIWKLQLFTTDVITGTCSFRLTLVEPTATTYGKVTGALRVQTKNGL